MDYFNYQMVQKAALDANNILDYETRVNYHCIPKTGRKSDRAESCVGGFCVAFPMVSNRGGARRCYRIWFVDNVETLRFKEIADHVTKGTAALRPYFVDYTYIPNAMKVEDRILPGVKMEWIEGQELNKYLETHNNNKSIQKLADSFLNMCKVLYTNKVAHGDLSNSNILITPSGEIRLIDYDSVYVPSMGNGFYQTTKGQPAFQHPERAIGNRLMSSRDDCFSQQIIYLSLLAIAKKPHLISLISSEELLFTATDLESLYNYRNSKGYQALAEIHDPIISLLTEELGRSISGPLNKVKSIVEIVFSDADTSVQIKHKIGIKQPEHGLLLAYPPQAVAGETIGVRYNNNKPNEYKIKDVNVIASGSVWKLGNQRRSQTQDSNEPFESVFGSFKMPDSDVTLEAVFEKTTKEPKQSIKCPSCNTNYYKTYSKYCHHCGMKRI